MGYYSFDAGTPITAGTWRRRRASADVALTAARLMAEGGHIRLSRLCRPPGHHAAADLYGGYCFLNNAAIAAQYLIDGGAERVAILDVDYHHGNGTQAIFYDRPDVLFLSLHADPREEYPFFLGWADETGDGAGEGFNVNYPLPRGTAFPAWSRRPRGRLPPGRRLRARTCLSSRSAWTPTRATRSRSSGSRATTSPPMAARIARPRPAHPVRHGGRLCVEQIGLNTVNVLQGFEAGLSHADAPLDGRPASRARAPAVGRTASRRSRAPHGRRRPAARQHRTGIAGDSRAPGRAARGRSTWPLGRIAARSRRL